MLVWRFEDFDERRTLRGFSPGCIFANSTALAEANLALRTKANITDVPTNVPGYVSLILLRTP